VSDGSSPYDGVVKAVGDMAREGITVSTIALDGADTKLLYDITDAGNGRAYTVDDLSALERVFEREISAL
jgi:hypothetical protein